MLYEQQGRTGGTVRFRGVIDLDQSRERRAQVLQDADLKIVQPQPLSFLHQRRDVDQHVLADVAGEDIEGQGRQRRQVVPVVITGGQRGRVEGDKVDPDGALAPCSSTL